MFLVLTAIHWLKANFFELKAKETWDVSESASGAKQRFFLKLDRKIDLVKGCGKIMMTIQWQEEKQLGKIR